MNETVFSYFQFRTRLSKSQDLHVQLQPSDQDSGRFWLTMVYALRSLQPDIGQAVLSRLIDHHSAVDDATIRSLLEEFSGWKGSLIIENSNFLNTTPWRPQFERFCEEISSSFARVVIEDCQPNSGTGLQFTNISAEQKKLLAVIDSWWLDWCIEMDELKGLPDDCSTSYKLTRWNVILPAWSLQKSLGKDLRSEDYAAAEIRIKDLQQWLSMRGQWLESLRYDILLKNFEQAADGLEESAGFWQIDPQSTLEQLFWMRELPSVLLSTRPLLCLQAAVAANRLQLPLQVSYYANLAEQQLTSLRRLARSESEWLSIPLNDQGKTVAELTEELSLIHGGR